MRIATWNVNSLKARLDKVCVVARARAARRPADAGDEAGRRRRAARRVPRPRLRARPPRRGALERGRHRQPRPASTRSSPTSASRCARAATPDAGDDEPLAEARMISAVCGGVRVVSLYAPNGRTVDSPFYQAKLAWFERLARWLAEACGPTEPLVLGGDFNVAPDDADVWDPARLPRRHPRLGAGARGLRAPVRVGTHRRLPPAPPRAGALHLVGLPRRQLPQELRHAHRSPAGDAARRRARRSAAEIDREARKGKPIPSDHAPLVVDLDEPGHAFDAGWADAEARIARRLR